MMDAADVSSAIQERVSFLRAAEASIQAALGEQQRPVEPWRAVSAEVEREGPIVAVRATLARIQDDAPTEIRSVRVTARPEDLLREDGSRRSDQELARIVSARAAVAATKEDRQARVGEAARWKAVEVHTERLHRRGAKVVIFERGRERVEAAVTGRGEIISHSRTGRDVWREASERNQRARVITSGAAVVGGRAKVLSVAELPEAAVRRGVNAAQAAADVNWPKRVTPEQRSEAVEQAEAKAQIIRAKRAAAGPTAA